VIVLGIESSTARSSVALLRDGVVIAHEEHEDARGHGAFLAPAMRRCLDVLDAVDAVAVGTGPGLYTGLRVGMATASAFATARAIPVVGVAGMDALALGSGLIDRCVVTTIDARRGQVFWAVHAPTVDDRGAAALRCTGAPTVGTREELDAVVRGLAAEGPVQIVGEIGADALLRPDATDTARLAQRLLTASGLGSAHDDAPRAGWPGPGGLEPVYLREADVRVGWNERGGVRVGGA
jgi:tRNA threonylcarbamoyladenosine biosynthesis protein TsaB